MDTLKDRISSRPILPVKVPIIIGIMFNFDGHDRGNVTCKQTLKTNSTFPGTSIYKAVTTGNGLYGVDNVSLDTVTYSLLLLSFGILNELLLFRRVEKCVGYR